MASCHSRVTLMLRTLLTLQEPHIPTTFIMYFVYHTCVTPVNVSNVSGHYHRNRSTLDIGVISAYFDIGNAHAKSGTFLLGHPVLLGFASQVGREERGRDTLQRGGTCAESTRKSEGNNLLNLKIILKWMLNKWGGRTCAGLVWLMTVTGRRLWWARRRPLAVCVPGRLCAR
jgi:hypothetical protein